MAMLSPSNRRRTTRANTERNEEDVDSNSEEASVDNSNTLNDLTTGLYNSQVPMTRAGFHALLRQRDLHGLASSPLSASPSPDELAILARGRRQMPITFSPDVHLHTPPRRVSIGAPTARHTAAGGSSGNRLWLLPKRSSPRKRLNLSDLPSTPTKSSSASSSVFFTPSPESRSKARVEKKKSDNEEEDKDLMPPSVLLHKKLRMDEGEGESTNIQTLIQGLSAEQLVSMITNMLKKHPEVKTDLLHLLPEPDLTAMEVELVYFRKNITKALPNTRLEPKTGPMAYNRAALHLQNFHRTLVSQSKKLVDAQQYKAVVEHSILAWTQIRATPEFDNTVHNNVKKKCFKAIAANCLLAVKANKWIHNQASSVLIKLRTMEKEGGADITDCVQHLEHKFNEQVE